MSVEQWRELRRAQAVRVANASRHKRDRELELYRQLVDVISQLEGRDTDS